MVVKCVEVIMGVVKFNKKGCIPKTEQHSSFGFVLLHLENATVTYMVQVIFAMWLLIPNF